MQTRIAGLFWYYKDPVVCRSRIAALRHLNPEMPLYGLYGGSSSRNGSFDDPESLLDDVYGFSEDKPPNWKWRNGDLLILDWYKNRGKKLDFDAIVVLQWDLLLTAPVKDLLSGFSYDDVFFSSTRTIDEVPPDWYWTNSPAELPEFAAFRDYLKKTLGYDGPTFACEFVVCALSRKFLNLWCSIDHPEIGFLEYKLPTFASMFGCAFYQNPALDTDWKSRCDTRLNRWRLPLSTRRLPVSAAAVRWHYSTRSTASAFHPFVSPYDVTQYYRAPERRRSPGSVCDRNPELCGSDLRDMAGLPFELES